jgi:hypothetical protein
MQEKWAADTVTGAHRSVVSRFEKNLDGSDRVSRVLVGQGEGSLHLGDQGEDSGRPLGRISDCVARDPGKRPPVTSDGAPAA